MKTKTVSKRLRFVGLAFFCFMLSFNLLAQDVITVKGKVTDSSGEPLPGVSIVSQGTINGTITNPDGIYSLSKVPARAKLVFSFVGMKTKEITVAGKTTIDVMLEEDAIGLDEVVAIGYGTTRKSDLISAVSKIDGKSLEAIPTVRVEDALQGKTAGVQITKNSGAPGGEVRVRVRGANSITGNNNPLYIVDGIVRSSISNLNSNDIASVEVLKDASATAIYGSRGANGVILVTTQKGKAGKTSINLDYYGGVSNVAKRYDLLSAWEFAEAVNALNGTEVFDATKIAALKQSGGTNYQDAYLQTGQTQSVQLSASGGSDKTTFYLSANYFDNKGVLINTDYNKLALRSNIETKLSERLIATLNFSGSRETFKNITNDAGRGGLNAALGWDPTTSITDANGNYNLLSQYAHIEVNPVAVARERESFNYRNTLDASSSLKYNIANGLDITVQLGGQLVNNTKEEYTGVPAGSEISNPGSSLGGYENLTWQNTNILSYKKLFGEKHSLNLIGVFEQQQNTRRSSGLTSSKYAFDGGSAYTVGLGTVQSIDADYYSEAIRSYVARADYSFDARYMIGASVRVDGSSKFRKANRYSTFPSVSLGWRISNEQFLKDNTTISELKLRASYGVTGNQAISPYSTYSSLSIGNSASYSFDGSSATIGTRPGSIGNEDLKWETTTQYNVGLDLGLKKGKVNFGFDLYKKITNNLLLAVPAPKYTGVSSIMKNVGEVENKGFEVSLGLTPIATKKFTWDIDANFSLNNNKVTKLFGDTKEIFPGSNFPSTVQLTVVQLGESLGQFYGYEYLGTWKNSEAAAAAALGKKPGDARYSTETGAIGNALPSYIWGLNSKMKYQNFELSFSIQAVQGFDVFNQTRAVISDAGGDMRNPTSAEIRNRWTATNETDIPALSATSEKRLNSSRFVEDGSFIRMKNVYLGYNFPQNALSRTGIKGLTLYTSVQNLFTITKYSGYDPEVSVSGRGQSDIDTGVDLGAYPNPQTYIFGVKLDF